MTAVEAQATSRALSAGCGLLMASAAGVGSHGPATAVVVATAVAALAGVLLRPLATVAVLLAVAAIVLCDPAPVFAAASGLAAAAYLVLRYAADGVATVTLATMVAAVGFTFVGLVAAAFPLQLPWLPLAAPLAAFGCYVWVIRPFVGVGR